VSLAKLQLNLALVFADDARLVIATLFAFDSRYKSFLEVFLQLCDFPLVYLLLILEEFASINSALFLATEHKRCFCLDDYATGKTVNTARSILLNILIEAHLCVIVRKIFLGHALRVVYRSVLKALHAVSMTQVLVRKV
jgi:hypothetical protein